MMLMLLLGAVAIVAMVPILLPLLRGSRPVMARGSFDQAVYRDQLQELDRDVARGVIGEADAVGARLEIQRRLLAADSAGDAREARLSRSPVLAGAVAVLALGGAGGLYLLLGDPDVPDLPYAARSGGDTVADNERMGVAKAAAQLAQQLATDPTNGQAWLLYARTQAMMSQWDKAAEAFQRALALGQTGPDVLTGYGEMLVMQAQGIVTPAARDAFTVALKDDPKNEVARYYTALAAGQAGEPQRAITQLQALAADLPSDAPMRAEIGKRVQEAARDAGVAAPPLPEGKPASAAPGPDPSGMAAAALMPEADRRAMITTMVQNLAARLVREPNDLDGWLRLGRAYSVLGDRDKEVDAYDHASALKPADPEIKLMVVGALLTGVPPSDPFPPRAVTLLREVQLVSPDEPGVLWYLGVLALHDGHKDEARSYWTRLLAKLPPDGEDAGTVKAALGQVR